MKSTKSNRERIVPLNSAVVAALRSQRVTQNQDRLLSHGTYQDNGFVFADEIGGMLDLDAVSKGFAKLARQIGIKANGITLHSLRHTAATLALGQGADVKTVSSLPGHENAASTLRIYAHAIEGAGREAVAAIGDAFSAAQAAAVGGESGRP